jgi:hypothetical protein
LRGCQACARYIPRNLRVARHGCTGAGAKTTQIKSFKNKNEAVALREKEAAVTLQNSRLAGQSCNSFDTLVGLTPVPVEHRHFSDIGNQIKK